MRVLLEQGRLHGVFNVGEQKMIENVFELDDLRVSEIMTPRTKITWLDVNDPLYKHLEVIAENSIPAMLWPKKIWNTSWELSIRNGF
ncbi:MAG: hypothetical protein EP149_11450 [Phascolarctobacterium sp.]|nr:hypothetical protein [Phascolarctobacterium sp.]